MPNICALPDYLQKYIVNQDYEKYTSVEHATWRCIMRQLGDFFVNKNNAVDAYQSGLSATGIPLDRIPSIAEMNEKLDAFGWAAVGVEGFIPSSVFLDLLARGILPIACDMRTIDHIAYTPAPDIVHESAGHAPILADKNFRAFLERYAQIAYRAIISDEDIVLYEAIRYLSDIKENPDMTAADVVRAEQRLNHAYKQLSYVSEAGKVARLAWWTIEYGLVGDLNNLKIYGAALLSSIGESTMCLNPKVKKIPLSLDCLETGYDITEHQPQLFYAPTLAQLSDLVGELESQFSFKKGGVFGLETALKANTLNTMMFDNEVSVSGILESFLVSNKRVSFLKLKGNSQICFREAQIANHGREVHAEGFSSPIGRWSYDPSVNPSSYNLSELKSLGLSTQKECQLEFVSGFVVKGYIQSFEFFDTGLGMICWQNCTVTLGDKVYYQPDWGPFDMVVADAVTGVFAGPGDRSAFGDYEVGRSTTTPGKGSPHSTDELKTFDAFSELRGIRQNITKPDLNEALRKVASLPVNKNCQWLFDLEIIEIAQQHLNKDALSSSFYNQIVERLGDTAAESQNELGSVIRRGLDISSFHSSN